MKKTLTIIILLLFTVQVTGIFILFRFQQHEIKLEMKAYLADHPKHHSVVAITDDPAISWESASEFNFKGVMYDIIRTTTINGQKTFLCIEDKKESELIKNFLDLSSEQSKSAKTKANNILQLISAFYEPQPQTNISFFFIAQRERIAHLIPHFTNNNFEVVTPPPRLII